MYILLYHVNIITKKTETEKVRYGAEAYLAIIYS